MDRDIDREARMKLKKIILLFVAVLVLAATVPTAARAAGTGSGTLSADKNNVSVSLTIPEGKTKTITSLRVQLRVSVTNGTMGQPYFTFDASVPSTVKSAVVKKEGSAYMVDIILSGKKNQDIFKNSENAKLGILSVKPDSTDCQIKVEFAGKTDGGNAPVIKYAESSSLSEVKLTLSNALPAIVGSEAHATVPPSGKALGKPKLTATVKKGKNRIYFKWNKISGASGYRLYRYDEKTKKYKKIKTVTKGGTTSCSQKYGYASSHRFRLRAFKIEANGEKTYGSYSSIAKVTVPPAKAKKLSAEYWSDGKAALQWKKVSKAKGYQIYRSRKKNGKYFRVKTIRKGKIIKCTSIKHKFGKTYYYKIRAYVTGADKKRVYGKFSAAVPYKNKGKQ